MPEGFQFFSAFWGQRVVAAISAGGIRFPLRLNLPTFFQFIEHRVKRRHGEAQGPACAFLDALGDLEAIKRLFLEERKDGQRGATACDFRGNRHCLDI